MLRIFGYYQFDQRNTTIDGNKIIEEMIGLPHTKSDFTNFTTFNFRNIFLGFETLKSKDANKYFYIDNDERSGCFVIGNIFAFQKEELILLNNINIAEFIFRKYKEKDFVFLNFLRGEFNIFLVDKGKLYIANDRLGLSSLFIYKIQDGIFFCNEAEPIIWLSKNNIFDANAVSEFLALGFILNGKTFVRNLYNQPPGTLILFDKNNFILKNYYQKKTFSRHRSSSLKKVAESVNNLFFEAVKIRLPSNAIITQELSGGWDTRFILAHMLALKVKSIHSVTFRNTSEKDIVISKHLSKKFKIKNHLINELRNNLSRAFEYKFRLNKKNFFAGSRNNFLISEKNTSNIGGGRILLSQCYTGLFGTEIFGYVPPVFIDVFKHNETLASSTKEFFLKNKSKLGSIFKKNLKNVLYLYMTQYVRSYWNVYINIQRDRLFDYFALNPFADSKTLAFLDSENYNQHVPYELYTEMYRQFAPSLLKIPYTFTKKRKMNYLKDNFETEFNTEMNGFKNMSFKDKVFLSFLKKNSLLKKIQKIPYVELRKLYCLCNWFNTYRPVLSGNPSTMLEYKLL